MNRRERISIDSLELKGMGFAYEEGLTFFKEVNFGFPMNTVALIKGESGSGKSSLLKILVGLLEPTEGQYLLNEIDVSQMSFEDFLPYRLNIGFSFDMGGLLNNRTLYENLMLPLLYHNEFSYEKSKTWVDYVIKKFGLLKESHQRPAMVSGRSRKACVVARSLIMKPQVLILDDPFVGLTKSMIEALLSLIAELRAENILHHIFISTGHETMEGFSIQDLIEIENHKLFLRKKELAVA